MSNVILKLKTTTDQGSKYSGDLLASMEVLKNTTQIFRGAGYSIRNADVEVTRDSDVFEEYLFKRCLCCANNVQYIATLLLILYLFPPSLELCSDYEQLIEGGTS